MTFQNIAINFVVFLFALVLPLCVTMYWSIRFAIRHERNRTKSTQQAINGIVSIDQSEDAEVARLVREIRSMSRAH